MGIGQAMETERMKNVGKFLESAGFQNLYRDPADVS